MSAETSADPSIAEPAAGSQAGHVRAEVATEGPAARRVEVTVAAERVRRSYDRAYRDLAKRARVRGFRPGKTPRRVLERIYGPSISEEIERELVQESLPLAIEQVQIEPVSPPSVESTPPDPERDFSYVARVEVRPPVELPAELEGLPGQRPPAEVADDEVDRELEQLRERHATLVEEPEGNAAEVGHVLSVDFVGRVDGAEFEGGSGRGVEIEIGAERFVPGFEEQLVGARAGDDREVRVRFPEDYGRDELAGQEALFQVHVGEVKRRERPALDDEFAKDLGDFDSLDALRAHLRGQLEKQRNEQADSALRRSLLTALAERAPFDVPPGVTEAELEQRLRGAAQQLHGAVPDDALRTQLERWREEWRPAAEGEVRERWLLEAVADRIGADVSEPDIAAEIERMAAAQGASVERLRAAVDEALLEASVRRRLRREKALDFLASTARVEEVSDT